MTIPPEATAAAIVMMGLKYGLDVVKGLSDWRGRKESPEQRDVSIAPELVTRPELNEIKEAVKEIRQQIAANNMAAEKRAESIHERINPIVNSTGELVGAMKAFTQSFEAFTQLIISMNQRK